ncbi:hypothetical protein BDF21DRAFT_448413 [Thamnidium elegans]|nr:hypothetical protein BDF21DRAFT_448413 [Thamnidium elegans]
MHVFTKLEFILASIMFSCDQVAVTASHKGIQAVFPSRWTIEDYKGLNLIGLLHVYNSVLYTTLFFAHFDKYEDACTFFNQYHDKYIFEGVKVRPSFINKISVEYVLTRSTPSTTTTDTPAPIKTKTKLQEAYKEMELELYL